MDEINTSIILLTKNAGKDFGRTLEAIARQKNKDYELIIIDSESNDSTLGVIKQYKQKFDQKKMILVQILSKEFGHGKTRNLGAKIANGENLVFLTQDAIPTNENWLDELIEPLKEEGVAGVFGRQLAKKDSSITQHFFNDMFYPDAKKIRTLTNGTKKLELEDIFFSNVNSAIKKSVWKQYQFDEEIIMSEDQKWAKEVLLANYKTAYVPNATVWHSHDYNLKQVFQRYFDSSLSLRKVIGINLWPFIKRGMIYNFKEWKYILKKNPLTLLPTLLYDTMRISGSLLGMLDLPLFLKKKFSLHKEYWNSC